jgi:AsmA protein
MRWLFRLGLLVVLLVALAVAGLMLMPTDRIAAFAARQFEAATGRALTLSGDTRPTLWPVLGVATGPVTIANAGWSDSGPMIAAEGLAIGLKPMALLRGEIAVERIRIDAPRILLERAGDGRANWEIAAGAEGGKTAAPEAGGRGAPPLAIDRAEIRGGALRYVDHASGRETVVAEIDLDASLSGMAGLVVLKGSARVNGAPVSLDATLDGLGPMLAGEARTAKIAIAAGANKISFDGSAGMAPVAVKGRLETELPDMPALLAAAGPDAPALPPAIADARIALSGDLGVGDSGSGAFSATLRAATFRLNDTTITGEAAVTLAGRPRVTATLDAGALDLSGLSGGADNGAGGGSGGWPSDPIDASGLSALDAQVDLRASEIKLDATSIGAVDIGAKLGNGRLALDIRKISAYEGLLSGALAVDGRSGLAVEGDLAASGMQLRPLLTQIAGYDRLLGPLAGQIGFSAAGGSVDALMKSLSGAGKLDIGQGELQGFDIAGMLRNLDTSFRGAGAKTVFNSVTGTFTIDKGVLRNDDLLLDAPLISVTGAGAVNIGGRSVDYRLAPAAAGVSVPVLISGPWASPGIRPDLAGVVPGDIATEAGKLGDKARGAVGGALGSGDAAKGVEDKAKGLVRGLLGGD